MDYEDYVRNDAEIKEKIVGLKKDLKVFSYNNAAENSQHTFP